METTLQLLPRRPLYLTVSLDTGAGLDVVGSGPLSQDICK